MSEGRDAPGRRAEPGAVPPPAGASAGGGGGGMGTPLGVIGGALAVLFALAWLRGGPELALDGLSRGGGMIARYAALIALSFLAAGLAEVLIPHELVEGALGEDSGLRGIVLAAAAGALTPSGPFVSLPVAAALLRSGAAVGPVVAFVSGWAMLAVHRLVAWEVPILGVRLALLRYGLSLLLPVVAGLAAAAVARLLPLRP